MARWPLSVRRGGKIRGRIGPADSEPVLQIRGTTGGELRAVDDLQRSQANGAAAIQTLANLPTWGHFAAISRLFQDAGAAGCLAMVEAGRRDAHEQLPVCAERKMLAVVTLRNPKSGKTSGPGARTRQFGATAAVLHYNAVSRVMATLSVS